jgi:uncharacterized protein YllA (UPF0747 family)
MTTPRVITEELGGSPLARAAQHGELPQWYRAVPSGPDGWREYARSVAGANDRGAWLDRLLPALSPSGPAKQRLYRVAAGNGVVVSTGQQAALFGGPLYTLTKALSALAIADAIERETGVPAAPVFWAATDDADFQEASCARVALGPEVRALCLPAPAVAGIPMSALALGDLRTEIDGLRQASGSVVDHAPLQAVSATHVAGATLGDAYVELLRRLLEPLGIAVLDASHPATREAAKPLLETALDRAVEVDAALRARTNEIIAAGYEPQVELVAGLSLVFSTDEHRVKRRTPFGDQLRAVEAASLTPNVLLRPVVERAIMPTVAYVAGPGEIAYFAQVSAVAGALDVPVPLVVPRWSSTILEPRIERLLDRLGVRREELAEPHAVESRLARAAIPNEITAAIEGLRDDAAKDVADIAAADREKLIPPAALEGMQQLIRRRIERLFRRYTAAVKRREEQLMRDVATARASLFPDGKRQERVLNFIPFLSRNGRPLLDAMRAEAARHAAGLVAGPGVRPPASGAEVAERV